MSGYRSLHREQVQSENIPIWQVKSSPLLATTSNVSNAASSGGTYLIWTASADGYVRAYRVQEKDAASEDNALNASALTLANTHVFTGRAQPYQPSDDSIKSALGCTQVSIVRNYVGEDDAAGDYVVASLDMVGRVRVWTCTQEELSNSSDYATPTKVTAAHEFKVENASGTILSLCPPNIVGHGDVVVAVACMDGSVAMVATGISTPATSASKQKDPSAAGTILDKWGSGAIVLSLAWHPTKNCIVVGRKDGVVDVIPSTKQGTNRILHHAHPVRAVSFTPDAQLLVTGCDSGLLCVWDVNRKVPTLVHHVVQAHASWILGVAALADSRRFITLGADHKLHVWSVGQIYAPMHTFHCDHTMWTIHATTAQEQRQQQRLVCGSDHGFIQLYSLESA